MSIIILNISRDLPVYYESLSYPILVAGNRGRDRIDPDGSLGLSTVLIRLTRLLGSRITLDAAFHNLNVGGVGQSDASKMSRAWKMGFSQKSLLPLPFDQSDQSSNIRLASFIDYAKK